MAEAKKTTKTKTEPKQKQVKHAEVVAEAAPVEAAPEIKLEVEAEEPKTTAKAGKRSAKSVKEAEEKQAKEVRKIESKTDETDKKTKSAAKPPRSKLERAGKKYREAVKQIDSSKVYSLNEAVELVTKTNPAKFDATVEMHINLGVDPKQADQNVRDTVALPAGTGKDIKVVALDDTSAEKIFSQLDKEQIDFDVLVATPDMMPRLGKYARLLGPRGLMPSPKSGTVTNDVAAAVKEAKAGKVEYRVDQAGIIHLGIGKVSFAPEKLLQNAEAVLASVRAAKPASLKGIYIKSAYLSSSMGPSIKIEV
jgi:ribosomal protein L1